MTQKNLSCPMLWQHFSCLRIGTNLNYGYIAARDIKKYSFKFPKEKNFTKEIDRKKIKKLIKNYKQASVQIKNSIYNILDRFDEKYYTLSCFYSYYPKIGKQKLNYLHKIYFYIQINVEKFQKKFNKNIAFESLPGCNINKKLNGINYERDTEILMLMRFIFSNYSHYPDKNKVILSSKKENKNNENNKNADDSDSDYQSPYKSLMAKQKMEGEILKEIIDKCMKPMKYHRGYKSENKYPKYANDKLKLADYQKITIDWMINQENNPIKLKYKLNYDLCFYDTICYNSLESKVFFKPNEGEKITINGGGLIDEMGVGKTIQMIYLSLMNKTKVDDYIRDKYTLQSNATLIICPKHLPKQWSDELTNNFNMKKSGYKILTIATKTHYEKITYQEVLDADIIITHFHFLSTNKAFIKLLPEKEKYYDSHDFFRKAGKKLIEKVKKSKSYLKKTAQVLFPQINFQRIIIDEFHELNSVPTYKYIPELLYHFHSNNRWIITGTPFVYKNGNNDVLKHRGRGRFRYRNNRRFYSDDENENGEKDASTYRQTYGQGFLDTLKFLTNRKELTYDIFVKNKKDKQTHHSKNIKKLAKMVFKRNTVQSTNKEFDLPELKEYAVKLNFLPTERIMYNAKVANGSVHYKGNEYIRQLCCHPNISDETKDALGGCKSLEDIETSMKNHYKKEYKTAKKDFLKIQKRAITLVKDLNKLGVKEVLHSDAKEESDDKTNTINKSNNKNKDDSKKNLPEKKGKKITQAQQIKINRLKQQLDFIYSQARAKKSILTGKKSSFKFFKTVLKEVSDDTKKKKCGICFDKIPPENFSITTCGHMYCYSCIMEMRVDKCPFCRRSLTPADICQLEYTITDKEKEENEFKDAYKELRSTVGTKCAYLMYLLQKKKKKTIIFSQWEPLQIEIAKLLDEYKINYVFCKGNSAQVQNSVKKFMKDKKVKVIMLSTVSSGGGLNLQKARQVILMDPIYAGYEQRKKIEGQAICRAYRRGAKKTVRVYRLIIKDTIEDEIHKENIKNDELAKKGKKISVVSIDKKFQRKEIDDEFAIKN